MESDKEIGKDKQDVAVDNEGDVMMDDRLLEKEESASLKEISVQNNESPHSKDIKVEKERSPHLESTGGDKLELPQKSVDDATLHPGDGHEDQCLIEAAAAKNAFDPSVDGNSGITDAANPDSHNQPDTVIAPSEKVLETKAKHDKGKESNNVLTKIKSPNPKEQNLINGGTGMELTSKDETKEEKLNNGVTGMGLLPGNETKEGLKETRMELPPGNEVMEGFLKPELDLAHEVEVKTPNKSFLLDPSAVGGDESGTEEEQVVFMKVLETFHKERCLEFKPPRFYGEPLNCLKLWRAVIRLGGYEQVTSCKLWRQVGESFKPPKTCTTVSWTFRCFYEKALLEYEKHKMRNGELPFTDAASTEPASAGNQAGLSQASGSGGRARRDAAARAMQGWHSQRLLGNGEVGDPIIKDKNSTPTPKREKQLKSIGLLKRKKPSPVEHAVKVARMKTSSSQLDTMVVDIGPPADWVKINVQRTKDCFEVYALVPGLLREEVRVQSDPVGRLVISGQPEQLDNPWGVTPFKKVVSLPSRIDPHQTSAVVTLHGQLFVRVPFELSDL